MAVVKIDHTPHALCFPLTVEEHEKMYHPFSMLQLMPQSSDLIILIENLWREVCNAHICDTSKKMDSKNALYLFATPLSIACCSDRLACREQYRLRVLCPLFLSLSRVL